MQKSTTGVGEFGMINTSLEFTEKSALSAITAIDEYLRDNPICNSVEIDDEPRFEMSIIVNINQNIRKEVDDIFKGEFKKYGIQQWEIKNVLNYTSFYWVSDESDGKIWRLKRGGKPPCGMQYNHVIKNPDMYVNCQCPEQFKTMCRDITNILMKYVTKRRS
jgi:hypothetical protein